MLKKIKEYEERLQQAMLQSDVNALDELIAPDLIFTNHFGHVMAKPDDLEAHRSGVVKINTLTLSDQKIKLHDDMAIVSVQARIIGSFNGIESESDLRFTRVWSKTVDNHWQVIAGHASIVA